MNIPFRINKIKTLQFAMFPENLINDTIRVSTRYEFQLDKENKIILCKSGFQYSQGEKVILVLQIACYFDIEEKGFESFKQDQKIRIPVEFMRYLATISVGTARGVIHAKTENTPLNPIVLPPINLVEAIKNDYLTN
jgi:hypothetical protein